MSKSFHTLKISKLQAETEDTVSVSFEIPAELKDAYKYTQGQYLTLKFDIDGSEHRRAYSMSSSPIEEAITVTVKRVKGGVVSNHIHDNLKEGSSVEVMQPDGRFYSKLNPDHRKSYYMFAAGSGITPLMSIATTILEKESQSSVSLLYGNRNEDSIIFNEKLKSYTEKYSGQFNLEQILSKPKVEKKSGLGGLFKKAKPKWQGKIGRIGTQEVRKFLEDNKSLYSDSVYFICGPGNMIDTVEAFLIQKGVEKSAIHTERFVSANKTPGTKPTKASSDGGYLVTYILNGEENSLTVPKGKTILTEMIDQKLEPPYSCTSGACSTCMAKMTSGKVNMEVCYALDDDEIAAGYILCCQAQAVTEEVTINFDV